MPLAATRTASSHSCRPRLGVGNLGAVLLDRSLASGGPRHREGVIRAADDEQLDVAGEFVGGVRRRDDVGRELRRQPARRSRARSSAASPNRDSKTTSARVMTRLSSCCRGSSDARSGGR